MTGVHLDSGRGCRLPRPERGCANKTQTLRPMAAAAAPPPPSHPIPDEEGLRRLQELAGTFDEVQRQLRQSFGEARRVIERLQALGAWAALELTQIDPETARLAVAAALQRSLGAVRPAPLPPSGVLPPRAPGLTSGVMNTGGAGDRGAPRLPRGDVLRAPSLRPTRAPSLPPPPCSP